MFNFANPTYWFCTILLATVFYLVRTGRSFINANNYSLKDYLAYQLDQKFSLYPEFKTYFLLSITIILIIFGGLFYQIARIVDIYSTESATECENPDLSTSLWRSWTFLLDNSAHLEEKGALSILIGFGLSIGGMLIDALLVGLVADAIGKKMDDLKKGRSKVLEKNHTLILGWNDRVLPLIREIMEANESEGGGVIVILSERPKEEMEEDIRNFFDEEHMKGSYVVCRNGNPLLVSDLNKVSAEDARSIAVLANEEGDPDESDARAVRIVLALCKGIKIGGHVVVEIRDIDNSELIHLVGDDKVEIIVSHDIIGRLMIQCARQPFLAQMYMKLLGFFDNEFYIERWDEIVGKKFDTICQHFPEAVPCGVKRVNYPKEEGPILLNPPRDYVFQEGDSLLVIAEDNDSYSFKGDLSGIVYEFQPEISLPSFHQNNLRAEKILFCGWRRDLDDMITELEKCVAAGSELHIMSTIPINKRGQLLEEGGLYENEGEGKLKLIHHVLNQTVRRHLEKLPIEQFDSILILAESDDELKNPSYADSRSLSTLLLLRDIQTKRNVRSCTVISEILDPRTKQLISVADISDYVVSNELVSMSIAMILEQRETNQILSELFTAVGSEVFMRSILIYALPGEELNFWELTQRAGYRREILIGYKLSGEDVVLNPSNKNLRRKWEEKDILIVIAVD